MSNSSPRRRFTLLDACLFVFATACAAAVHRCFGEDVAALWRRRLEMDSVNSPWVLWRDRIAYCEVMLLPTAFVTAPTLAVLRFIPPRPPRRRLATLSGATAGLAAVLAISYRGILIFSNSCGTYVSRGAFDPYFFVREWLEEPPWGEGLAVAGAWFVLAVGGRLRSEPTWIDRAGRVLGGYFLGCLVFGWLEVL